MIFHSFPRLQYLRCVYSSFVLQQINVLRSRGERVETRREQKRWVRIHYSIGAPPQQRIKTADSLAAPACQQHPQQIACGQDDWLVLSVCPASVKVKV